MCGIYLRKLYVILIKFSHRFYDEGYKDGHAHGRIHGLIEGRALGREKGYEMWEELGFYEGFALMWRAILDKHGGRDECDSRSSCGSLAHSAVHSRATSNIKHLLELIAQFPRINPSATGPSDLDIPKLFRQIRSRYKALCATLGVRPTLRASGPAGIQDGQEDPGDTPNGGTTAGGNSVWKIDNKHMASSNTDLSF